MPEISARSPPLPHAMACACMRPASAGQGAFMRPTKTGAEKTGAEETPQSWSSSFPDRISKLLPGWRLHTSSANKHRCTPLDTPPCTHRSFTSHSAANCAPAAYCQWLHGCSMRRGSWLQLLLYTALCVQRRLPAPRHAPCWLDAHASDCAKQLALRCSCMLV